MWPLEGLRIVELSSYIASPLCGLVLQQLGADVIRVEPLGGAPDRTRLPRSTSGTSLYWNGLNKGKRAVAIDLDQADGREIVAELVVSDAPSDVTTGGIIVSNGNGYPELQYGALRERRADVIHVVLTGRSDGSSAVDYTVQAATGFPLVTGPDDYDRPINNAVPAWDIAAGLFLATGVLAADRERRSTGRGQQVQLALEDVALATSGALGYLAAAQLGGVNRPPSGNDVYGTYGRDFLSSDGVRFMLVVLTASHWRRLIRSLGISETVKTMEMALGAVFEDEVDRYVYRKVISALLEPIFNRMTWAELEPVLHEARSVFARYRSFDELATADDGALRSNPLFAELDQPGVGRHLAPGSPLVMGGRRRGVPPAPQVGEHTEEVLTELGVDRARIATLRSRGVIR